jgi:hypothetical protein
MAKSSLKTFLRGENPYQATEKNQLCTFRLKDSHTLHVLVDSPKTDRLDSFYIGPTLYLVDVLDDGTAITYCPLD